MEMGEVQSSVQCPKCGLAQASAVLCAGCGIVFAKYALIEQAQRARSAESAARSAEVEPVMAAMTGMDVQQRYHMAEAAFGFERANQYRVRLVPGTASKGDWTIEESNHRGGLSILGRQLFDSFYTFSMRVSDEVSRQVLEIERRARLYLHAVDVFDENGVHIGSAERCLSLVRRVMRVTDTQGREVMTIVGPYFKPWTFELHRQGQQVGVFSKRFSGSLTEAMTDADRFSLRFSEPLPTRDKRLLFGAVLLLDSLYFEGGAGFLGHFFGAPGMQLVGAALTLCAMWMTGGTPPV